MNENKHEPTVCLSTVSEPTVCLSTVSEPIVYQLFLNQLSVCQLSEPTVCLSNF